MDKSYKGILDILSKVRGRLTLKRIINILIIGFSVALGIGVLMAVLSRIMPIYNVYIKWAYGAVLIIMALLIYSICTRPDLIKCAKEVDALGLKERVTTALEIKNMESPYKALLVEDALSKLKSLEYRRHINLMPSKKWMLISLSLLIMLSIAYFMPNPLKVAAEKKHKLNTFKKEQIKKADASKKEVKDNKKLTEEKKKELLAKLEELKLQIKNSKEIKDVDKAIEKTAKKLELDKKEKLSEDLKKLAEKLAHNNETKKLSEAIKNNDLEKMQKALDELRAKMKNSLDSAAKEKLKQALSNASQSLGDKELAEALDSMSSTMASGNEAAISSSVSKVSGKLKSALSEEAMNNILAQLQQNLQVGQQSGQIAGQGQSQGQGIGNGQGQGNGSGQGQGSGNGQGQGAGGGAGSGSSNKDGGVTNYGTGGIANKKPGAGQSKEYEKIYAPKRLGGDGESSKLTGKNNGNSSNSESYLTEDYNAELGELVPYNQVSGEYTERAMENLNSYEIPEGMMDLVKDYFSSLQE